MSKTGGGKGTNQHQVKGVSSSRKLVDFATKYSKIPVAPDQQREQYEAIDPEDVKLASLPSDVLQNWEHGSSDRAIARYQRMKSEFVFASSYLEENSFTLPEVKDLVEHEYIPSGKTELEINQVIALNEASQWLSDATHEQRFSLTDESADTLNGIIVQHEAIDAGKRRQFSEVNAGGEGATVNTKGNIFIGYRKDQLSEAESIMYRRIMEIDHPVERSLNYAASMTYLQSYMDGNKRTARYMMDGNLMTHGYDAIIISSKEVGAFHDSVAQLFRTGDFASYVNFLARVAVS